MTVLIMGGTTEGRQIAEGARALGCEILVSTATKSGEIWAGDFGPVRSGRLDSEGLNKLIREKGIKVVIDATHPFAGEVSRITRETCDGLGLPYLRMERPPSRTAATGAVSASSVEEAAALVVEPGRRVFLATGVQTLALFVRAAREKDFDTRFFARVLPTVDSITEAVRWLPPSNIVAAVGPFDRHFNSWCWRTFTVDTIVTKDSGADMGVEEKVETALEMGLRAVVVARPAPPAGAYFQCEEILAKLEALGVTGAVQC